ncbi:hypothetical protein A0H81_04485 [Grifola frondosa]|uniref:Uncharacterized protein n=1 Tax=Grifola frondosa TaxID=5627 RepID=A0A1C7MEB2_GRIFR|nr:hypothetical protein A0H81_04485 [Grifola frondosa]
MTIKHEDYTRALVSLFDDPDPELLRLSYGTLWACKRQHHYPGVLRVVHAKSIQSVVVMVPLPMTICEVAEENLTEKYKECYFMMKKMGLEVAFLGGLEQNMDDED